MEFDHGQTSLFTISKKGNLGWGVAQAVRAPA
jgi:hypothetical protein